MVVDDPDLAREVLSSKFSSFFDRGALEAFAFALPRRELALDRNMLFHEGGEQWRVLRAAWASYLGSSKALRAYSGIMKQEVKVLCERIAKTTTKTANVPIQKFVRSLTMSVWGGQSDSG